MPEWELLYDFIDEYGVKDLSPSSLKKLSDNFLIDSDFSRQYWENRYKLASGKNIKYGTECDQTCRLFIHCET
jgi:hypothetical protein